jgi:hypothetical protein
VVEVLLYESLETKKYYQMLVVQLERKAAGAAGEVLAHDRCLH